MDPQRNHPNICSEWLYLATKDEKSITHNSAAWHLWMTHSSQAVDQPLGQQQRGGLVMID